MSRFKDDSLFALGFIELLNFVNFGECDGATVSLFWPFDDARYKPIYADVSRSLPNLKAGQRGWQTVWPASLHTPHRALRRALLDQLTRVVKEQPPILPTWVGWTLRSFERLSPIEAATVTAMRYAFDDVLGNAPLGGLRMGRCKLCTCFYATGRDAGRPSHFCTEDHRADYRGTSVFKEAQAAHARMRRADDRARQARAAAAVGRKPPRKTDI